MGHAGRIAAWRDRWAPFWLGAIIAVLLALGGAWAPWTDGQRDLADWRTPEAAIRWLPARAAALPRYPAEGERPQPLRRLPFGASGAVQLSFTFQGPAEGAERSLALVAPKPSGRTRLFINGAPVSAEAAAPKAFGPATTTWPIPDDHLRPGDNRLDMLVDGADARLIGPNLFLGPHARLQAAINARMAVSGLLRATLLEVSLLALAASLLAAAARALPGSLPLAAAFSAVAVRTLLQRGGAGSGLEPFWPVLDHVLAAAMMVAAGLALSELDPDRRRWAERLEAAFLATVALATASILVATWRGAPVATVSGPVLTALGVTGLAWGLSRVLRRISAASPPGRVLTGGIVGLLVVAVWAAASETAGLAPRGPPFTRDIVLAGALSALALGWAGACGCALWRRIRAELQARFDQTETIARQHQVLDATARALDQKARQAAVLEERQRMARDVHDGIGGQLASLIAQVRMRRIGMEDVEQALVGGLSELRLLVDSFDVTGETLTEALATFQERARQQTTAAGVRLDWRQDDGLAADVRDPQWMLNLYRFLQEAIHNAIRHAGGDCISVEIANVGEGRVAVRILDNGVGFDPAKATGGRGLTNMAHRARELGGDLSITPGGKAGGMVVTLDFPVPRP